ncbi:hypothetical protein [Rossellomorea sp. YZS02]|uniref:hypothetical protein n=1 Tax=Rossellomorea sp. YZS02 TaxID=3097358 RepID=UPI002A0E740C|nr:hypothetical protein [Rossellomorea sp. YZS02]MDX8345786.1 hypothetical protein [Rossellomorea sp. YZS02]
MRFISIIILVFIILTGCSDKQSLELVRSSVEISYDRAGKTGITSGEKEGESIQPISLSYHFVLKNTDEDAIGGNEKLNKETYEYEDGLKVNLEPSKKLIEVSKEVMGFNIFNEEERTEAKMGMGTETIPVLEANHEGEYDLDFDLGALEENPEMRLAPSEEKLEKLINYAQDATLVIYIKDEEIARFDLTN